MRSVPADKNTKQKCIIMGVIIVIVFIIGGLTCLAIKRKLAQNAGVVDSMERKKQFMEFEKLFREQQHDLERLAEELVNSLEKKVILSCLTRSRICVGTETLLNFCTLTTLFNQKKTKDLLQY